MLLDIIGACTRLRLEYSHLGLPLMRMAGLVNGTRDALTRFTQPLYGSYYFVPSVDGLRWLRDR